MKPFLQRYDAPLHLFVALGFLGHGASLRWNTLRTKLWLRAAGCPYGPGLTVCGRPVLRVARRGALRLGARVTLQSRFRSNLAGGTGPTLLHCFDGGRIVFGDDAGCSFATISSRSSVTLGNRVALGANTRIYDHDFHPVDPVLRARDACSNVTTRPVSIGDDVFVGAQALILKGVTIGARAVIGAGAVVARDVPEGEIWAGNPARAVGKVNATPTPRTSRPS